jgi:hypothetical protein
MATLTREQVAANLREQDKLRKWLDSRMTREQAESRMREQVAGEREADAKAPADKRKELLAGRREALRLMQKTAVGAWKTVEIYDGIVNTSAKELEYNKAHRETNTRVLGVRLLEVKVRMPHGAFKAWWQQMGMTQARVSYAMRVAFGKVKAAKEKREGSPRAQALREVGSLLAELYDLGGRGKNKADIEENRERMERLYERIVGIIRQRFIVSNWGW